MTRVRRRLGLLLAGLVSACAGLNTGSDDGCAKTCATAYTCGFLPSILGYGPDAEVAVTDCERRCKQSPREDLAVLRILECLQGTADVPADVLGWCLDADAPAYTTGLDCAAAASCLLDASQGVQLVSGVSLAVSMVSFADYEAAFGEGSVAQLYTDDMGEVQSCRPALCGPIDCMRSRKTALPCDDAMCRTTGTRIVKACDQLQVSALDILVAERGAPVATLELLDETDSTECKQATATFDNATYHLNPGPARTYARFTGELPASELARLLDPPGDTDTDTTDTGDTTDTDDTAPTRYCLTFAGMAVTLRGGENAALVPIGGIDDILRYQARPKACDR
jgi:hypothetical protein